MKRCNKCGETKPVELFSRDRSASDGLQTRCKECNAEYRQAPAAPVRLMIRPRRCS